MIKNVYPKIYFGPMSKNIVDVLLDLSDDFPIGFIPSRRQVEYDGGYVNGWTTKKFYSYVKKTNAKVLVCRDHGGRLQGLHADDGVTSLEHDSRTDLDIIHIDPWKEYKSLHESAMETSNMIKHCFSINPNLKFEVGTEEAIHRYSTEELYDFLKMLKKNLGTLFDSIAYCVVQFGTKIVGTKNVGVFDIERSKKMIKVCQEFEVMSKEHNGDYLTVSEIKQRFDIGLDAINIAPEYGVYETTCLINHLLDNLQLEKLETFYNICDLSGKWKKWIPYVSRFNARSERPFYDYLICRVSGHYNFSNSEVLDWKKQNPDIDSTIKRSLKQKILPLLLEAYNEK